MAIAAATAGRAPFVAVLLALMSLAAWHWRRKLEAMVGGTAVEPTSKGALDLSPVRFEKLTAPAICSFFLPGLGQLIKGEVGRGLLFFVGWAVGLCLLVFPGVVVWIWAIKDAYQGEPLAFAPALYPVLDAYPSHPAVEPQAPQRTEWLDVNSPDGRFKLAGNLTSSRVRVWDAHATDFVATHDVPLNAIAEGLHLTESGAVIFWEVEDLSVLVSRVLLVPVTGEPVSVKLGALVQDIDTGRDHLVGVTTARSNRPDHSRKFIVLDGRTGEMLYNADLDEGGWIRFWGDRVVMVTKNQAGEEKRETLWKREA